MSFSKCPCIASSTFLLEMGSAKFLVGVSDGCFAVVAVLVLLLHLFLCCSEAILLNSSSNSFFVNSGMVGLETQLVVGVWSSKINWSNLSSRKPNSSFISCVERFDIMVAVANHCEVTSVETVVNVSVAMCDDWTQRSGLK